MNWMQRLQEIYYNPKHPAGFSRAEILAKASNVSKQRVEKWLKSQPTHTLHRPARKHYPTRQYIVHSIDEQWQTDLCDMQQLSRYNRGYKYILTVIDILSRYAWARPLKTKQGKEVTKAFKDIFRKDNRIPKRIQADQGSEFFNRELKRLFQSHNIELFSVKSAYKAALVERWNRTLKTKLWKFFTAKNNYTWWRILPDVVESYNNSQHRTIKKRPSEVTQENAMEVWQTLYGNRKSGQVPKNIKIGDRVRLSKVKRTFEKGYLPNWTEEEFFVNSINTKYSPTTFKVIDYQGEPIEGSFYRYEIQPVNRNDEIFIIERILKRERRGGRQWYYVRWRGYPPSMDSWVPQEHMQRLSSDSIRQY